MTAYLKWRGMLETTLSLYRAAGALAGIGATLCFSALHARLGALASLSLPAFSSETPAMDTGNTFSSGARAMHIKVFECSHGGQLEWCRLGAKVMHASTVSIQV